MFEDHTHLSFSGNRDSPACLVLLSTKAVQTLGINLHYLAETSKLKRQKPIYLISFSKSHNIFSYVFSSKDDRITYSALLELELEKDINGKEILSKILLHFNEGY